MDRSGKLFRRRFYRKGAADGWSFISTGPVVPPPLPTFDTLTLANAGNADVFVTKYNQDGRINWATRMTGVGNDVGNAVTLDGSGNVYVTGQCGSNPLTIFNADGTTFGTLVGTGVTFVFIVKYNTSGIAQWATRLLGSGGTNGFGITLDSSGNVYVTGQYDSTFTIFNAGGGTFGTLANSGSSDVFIVKYNTSGIAQWATRVAGAGSDVGRSISIDSSGNVYATGSYASNPVTIFNADGTTFGTLANTGSNATFIVKYNTSGTAQWATRVAGGGSGCVGYSIYVDSSGNVYATGFYSLGSITIFNAGGGTFGTLTNNSGGQDAFIVKYNTSGIAQWATKVADEGGDLGNGISVDSSGNVYVTGQYAFSPVTIFNAGGGIFGTLANSGSNDAFIVKYNTSGIAQWATRVAGAGSDVGRSISIDSGGNAYVAGHYASNPVTIFNADGTTFGTLANSGSNDVLLVKYNTSGTAQWGTRMDGTGSDLGLGIAVVGSSFVVTGQYASNPLTLRSVGF